MLDAYGPSAIAPEKPMNPMEASVLLECWLTADQSEDNWNAILKRYEGWKVKDSQARFLGTLGYYPKEGSFFSGLDERLYRFLCPTRCRPEDFPNLTREQYVAHARNLNGKIFHSLVHFLSVKTPNPNNFIRYRVFEWGDTIAPTFELIPDVFLEYLHLVINPMKDIFNNPREYSEFSLEAAQELKCIFMSESTPELVRINVNELLGYLGSGN